MAVGLEDVATSSSRRRFEEPAKFLPVAFICSIISGLYLIYIFLHCVPSLQVPAKHDRALVELVIFNVSTFLLVTCYLSAILTHPGSIPDKDEDPTWEYVPQDTKRTLEGGVSSQETKRTGDRRHCKWCAKYKPDRCHHCRVCRTCILKMDHHCPWIYNCVGFGNYKFFYLLLFYCALDCHIITWTMLPSLKEAIDQNTPFMAMFLLLFGESLAAFVGSVITLFFGFHCWLMLKAMTTIEFCEKQVKASGYDTSVYDKGFFGNVRAVLGDHMLLWWLPCSTAAGRGLAFAKEDTRLFKGVDTSDASRWAGQATGSGYGAAGKPR